MKQALTFFVILLATQQIFAQAQGIVALPAPKPDLTVTTFTVDSPAVLHCGTQTITVSWTEKNRSRGIAAAHNSAVYINGGPTFLIPIGTLSAGQSQSGTTTATFYNGPCDCLPTSYTIPIFMKADWYNTVAETNETNNNSATVTQSAACP